MSATLWKRSARWAAFATLMFAIALPIQMHDWDWNGSCDVVQHSSTH